MTADLATREKAALLAEELNKAAEALENARDTADEATFKALDKAHDDANEAFDRHPRKVMTNHRGDTFRCPMCKAPLLEEDLETE